MLLSEPAGLADLVNLVQNLIGFEHQGLNLSQVCLLCLIFGGKFQIVSERLDCVQRLAQLVSQLQPGGGGLVGFLRRQQIDCAASEH